MNLSFIKRLNAIQRLGYLGLLPFVLLPPLSALGLIETGQALRLFQLYSALILGFMAGVLWPVLYQSAHPTRRALVAVAFPVASIVGFAFLRPPEALVLQAALFLGLRLFEYLAGVDRQYPARYPQLRWQLTAVVVFMHLLYALVW
ncbi:MULTISPECIES: DUF3429 domain-containing protein [Marinimicrobium]|jgi:hypothetical protein|uniref:Uncharacterized protein DUF3429 n=1 Tax=Marinimicrobium koreense TaxID=306545 RepID=A0A3N1NZ91_9GAMM|nr:MULTISPECIES: DUF3429 domain-containing protein [Marinimicrobium]ROQ21505.1 uncharacterized protein DUF3429 [Marinimicrobium koreense]|tara:strand:+ start:147 stop:584 length:438 start_codon:yes stop_codon:yes gene_type:complete